MKLVLAALLVVACSHPRRHVNVSDKVETVANERAFGRLYNVVRWFHPSDECAALDWNRFAILGTARVHDVRDRHELKAALAELFAPIAPSVAILEPGESPKPRPVPTGTLTYWQRFGAGIDGANGTYVGKRRGIAATKQVTGFGMVSSSIPAAPYLGKSVRLRARARAGAGASAQLWLRVDRATGDGFFDNMEDRPSHDPAWRPLEIVGTVDADATEIVFGGLASGGDAWFDDFTLEVDTGNGFHPVPLANADFKDGLAHWGSTEDPDGYSATIADGAVRLGGAAQPVVDEPFEERPRDDEVVDVDLGSGLHARVPLVVARVAGHTTPTPTSLTVLPPSIDRTHREVWLADVVAAWSLFATFYPYLDVIGEDWDRALDDALRDAVDDATAKDHDETLDRLVARAHDGHARVIGERFQAMAPLKFAWVEGQVVVTASGTPTVRRGDVVLAIDGERAGDRLDHLIARTSGSSQWTRASALQVLAAGPPGNVTLKLARGEVVVPRGTIPPPPEHERPALGELEPGIWYVDLGRASSEEITAAVDKLAAARGIVFDMRGYPNSNHEVLGHVITKPDTANWMHIAHVVRPHSVAGWTDITWGLAPTAPHFANVVFVTGGEAISYAESVLGYVEAEGLPIIGSASAGANGDVQVFALPGGEHVSFTGLRVTKHDGTQHHLIGVRPTIPVTPTIAGIAAGRDEVLERAVIEVKHRRP